MRAFRFCRKLILPRAGGAFVGGPRNLAGKVIVVDPGHGGSDPGGQLASGQLPSRKCPGHCLGAAEYVGEGGSRGGHDSLS